MAVVVIGEVGFDLEVLAGEAQIVCAGAGEGLNLAPRLVSGLPDGGFGGICQAGWAAKVVAVHHEECGRGVDRINNGQR